MDTRLIQLIVFCLGTLGLAAYSRRALRQPRSHGFARFFAFTAILGLVVLNAPHWFHNPFYARQLLSWAALLGSLFLAVHGFYLLHGTGKPQGSFEDTTVLVTVGAYRYIRHPLYASLLLLGIGAFLKNPGLLADALLLVMIVALVFTARLEEAENIEHFGEAYVAYMARTRMFIPYIL
jgi:protein-S-isoprenylcysteine O-methyltransferase Ste14